MQNLDIYILTSIVATLFIVFFIAIYREFSRMGKEGYNPDPNEKKYGREALFVLAARLFEDQKVPKKDKEIIYKAMHRTISDMESDGIYFSEDAKEELKKQRDDLHCEYSGLPSVRAYEQNYIVKNEKPNRSIASRQK
jgi:hypothetical protein